MIVLTRKVINGNYKKADMTLSEQVQHLKEEKIELEEQAIDLNEKIQKLKDDIIGLRSFYNEQLQKIKYLQGQLSVYKPYFNIKEGIQEPSPNTDESETKY